MTATREKLKHKKENWNSNVVSNKEWKKYFNISLKNKLVQSGKRGQREGKTCSNKESWVALELKPTALRPPGICLPAHSLS